jgi:hypothetical protein
MALQPISNNMDELSQAEKVVAVLIDNQLISGLDAINVLKEIWENNKKEEPIKTLLPDIPVAPQRKNPLEIKDPINAPWEPYNPPKIWYQADHTGEKYPELPTQYSVKENANITTIATNDGGASSITWQEWDRNHLRAENPLNESKVFNRRD